MSIAGVEMRLFVGDQRGLLVLVQLVDVVQVVVLVEGQAFVRWRETFAILPLPRD